MRSSTYVLTTYIHYLNVLSQVIGESVRLTVRLTTTVFSYILHYPNEGFVIKAYVLWLGITYVTTTG